MRLSIIIPGYNTPEKFWRRCLKSVLLACGADDEIICVDDGSEIPAEANWLKDERGEMDSRVRLIRLNQNQGLPTARNEALKLATGRYVAFVDSDDEVLCGAYDKSIEMLEQTGNDIAIYGVRVIWTSNGYFKDDVLPTRNVGVMAAESLASIYRACLFDYAWNKVYRRGFLEAQGLRFERDVRTGEDTVFNCMCVTAGAKWCTVGCIGSIYYRYDGSMLSRYVLNMRATHRRKLEARAACRAYCPGVDELLGGIVTVSERELDLVEWRNMWKRCSPITFGERWRYLCAHRELCRHTPAIDFAAQMVYTFFRMHCYWRPVRRWQVRRLFPNVKEWKARD